MKTLEVDVLGPLRARLDDDEVNLGPARQRAVFAALATWPSARPMSRGELIRAVWGETAPASADGSVHTYVSGLRRVLDPERTRWSTDGPLVSDGLGYRLALGRLDTQVFDRCREQGEKARAAGDLREAVGAWDAALDLWRGDALSGIPGPWAEALRVRLTSARLAVVEARASALLALGSHEDLVPELIVLVREHPLREGLWQSLMRALHAGGRTTEALDAYRQVTGILRTELGVAPGPELRAVHQQVLGDGGQAAQPPRRRLLSVLPGQVARAFADPAETGRGRAHEVEAVRQLLDDVVAGEGTGLWLEGEAGIGKTSLLTTALRDAAEQGCHVAWAAAQELGRRFPFQVLMDALGLSATDNPATTEAVLAHVAKLCAQAPLVLVVDDLQWADDATLEVWRQLAAAARRMPLLLVAATRMGPRRAELTQLRRTVRLHGHEVLELAPLSDADVLSIVEDFVQGTPGPALRALVGRSAGNPMYLREVLGALAGDGVLTFTGDVVDLQQDTPFEPPESLTGAVTRTLDMLDRRTREVLRRSSVLGPQFGVGQAAAVAGEPVSLLLPSFENAITARVVVDAGHELAFRHPMLQATLYEELSPADRLTLHLRAARVVADTDGRVEQVAQQLVLASDHDDEWTVSWITEHRDELANRAPLVAVELMQRVLDSCPVPRQCHKDLLYTHILLLYRLGREPEAQAREAMATLEEPASRAEMRHITAAMLHRRGASAEALEVLERNDGPDVPRFWRQRMNSLRGTIRSDWMTDFDLAAERAAQACRAAIASGEPYPIAATLQARWLIDSVRRDHESALNHVERAIETVQGQEEHTDLLHGLIANKVFTLQNLDRPDEAGDTLRAARREHGRGQVPLALQSASAVQGFWSGDWDAALATLDAVAEISPGLASSSVLPSEPLLKRIYGVAAMINQFRGNGDEAERLLARARSRFDGGPPRPDGCDFLLMAKCMLRAHHHDDVEGALSLAAPMLDTSTAKLTVNHQWFPALARLALVNGNAVVAAEALAACEMEARKEKVPARAANALLWCRGIVHGDPEPILEAATRFRRLGRVMELSASLADAGRLLAGTDRRTEAQACLDEAAGILDRLGSLFDRERFELHMSRFGLKPSVRAVRDGRPPVVHALTRDQVS
ncbi:BTAD domain-containing putative transcriptional regulator [Lentzea sp. NBRC 102530]|uniref:BTAD domain-containing putative transcriptional regulator n=1 Tax=Lentzea sp. NBRC 102530 TaxID=3032201 RepID=UPI0024A062D2|nr:BTAD domain-containing putative transcriptional regulator [Lentzea sp. NBRC 102530]GLY46827.1 SARP family transcriptional regulator [Lentzea sp. NBRC 102530]